MTGPETQLTGRFLEGFRLAFEKHIDQTRKGTQIPYISHLMAVASLVFEHGGTEDQAVAALLHDAVEDQGGRETLQEIREAFGDQVAEIVDGCTDAYTKPKPPWKERKAAYLEKLRDAPDAVLLVSLADKVHNARSILLDLQLTGNRTWEKFTGKKSGTLWYYQSLANIFDSAPFPALKQEFRNLVEEMITLANLQENSL